MDVEYIMQKAQIGQHDVAADLGCGTSGHFVFPLARQVGAHGKVYAVDIQKTALDSISRRVKLIGAKNIVTVWSNLEMFNATEIEAASLDAAFLVNTLFLTQKRTEVLREAARMLKQGGRLVVADWQNLNIPFGPPITERAKKELIIFGAKQVELKLEEEFLAGPYHYGLVFTKL